MYEFPIRRNVRQSCYKYGVNISGKRCCGGFFAEDVVLKAPSKSCLRILLNKIHEWVIQNECNDFVVSISMPPWLSNL